MESTGNGEHHMRNKNVQELLIGMDISLTSNMTVCNTLQQKYLPETGMLVLEQRSDKPSSKMLLLYDEVC